MSYLQRLLDAAPAVLSIAPGNAAPSPVVAHDQRLGQFPDLLDRMMPTHKAEASPRPNPPVDVGRRSTAPAAEHAPKEAAVPLPLPDPAAATMPLKRDAPAPPPAEDLAIRSAADRPADPAAPNAETMSEMRVVELSKPLPKVHDPTPSAPLAPPDTETAEPGLAQSIVQIAASPITVPAWPIPETDFRPLEEASARPAPDVRAVPQTLPPAPAPAPVPAPDTPSAGTRPGPRQPAPAAAATLEPPADIAPSPLAGVPETAPATSQPAPAAARATQERDVPTVERIVEQQPTPVPATHPMTAAEVSVIGPISIGSPGPREMRARGWG
jgi:hypothetical protein